MNNPSLISITSLLTNNNIQLVIPIYQRKFSWAETKGTQNKSSEKGAPDKKSTQKKPTDRVEILFKYISDIASGNIVAPTNFIGFMVTQGKDYASALQLNKFHVIDGQQRLTTISLLVLALCKVCDDEVEELEKKIILNQGVVVKDLIDLKESLKSKSKEIRNKYIIHESVDSEDFSQRLRFIPSRHNIDAYIAICKNKLLDINGTTRTDPALLAYNKLTNLCRNYLKPEKNKNIDLKDIKNLLLALDSLSIVQLELVPNDDAKQIFETLNNAGMKLSEVDLIRNEIFGSDRNTSDLETLYKDSWQPIEEKFRDAFNEEDEDESQKKSDDQLFNFVRCILLMDGDYIRKNKVFSTFKERHASSLEKKKEFLVILNQFCERFLLLTNPDTNGLSRKFSKELLDASRSLSRIDFTSCFPLILKFFSVNEDEKHIAEAIRILENYYVRRQLNNISVRKLPEIITKLCEEYNRNRVMNKDCSKWLTEILKLDQDKPSKTPSEKRFYDYPTDLELETSLKSLNVYNQCFEITHHVYRKINQIHMKDNEYREASKRTEQQLDHILPQNLTTEWIDYLTLKCTSLSSDAIKVQHSDTYGLIGNLTLTGHNQSMSDSVYKEKIEDLKKSPYYYTVHIPTLYPDWTFDSIRNRNTEITKLVLAAFQDI